MLIMKILENDLHRSKNPSAVPFIVEVPARPEFVPAIVSSSRGKFIVTSRLTAEGRIRAGVFNHDYSKSDDLIPPMMEAALALSKKHGWGNVFGLDSVKQAFEYVREQSFMPVQPHVCIVPSSWDDKRIMKHLNTKQTLKYQRYCNIVKSDIKFVVFLSKPEMVGLYTRFLGGPSALVLHNVRRGMAFCE
jgi:hypothetical protein